MSARRESVKGSGAGENDFENIIHGANISDCGGDQNKLYGIVNTLLGRGNQALFPQHDDSLTLARLFNEFFITKIDNIRHEFPILEQKLPIV